MVENEAVAERLNHLNKLHRDRGDTFKANSYSKAAAQVRDLEDPVEELGEEELKEIEGIGDAIASKIREYVGTGEIEKIEELES
jgi:DNA polymerase (family 10)